MPLRPPRGASTGRGHYLWTPGRRLCSKTAEGAAGRVQRGGPAMGGPTTQFLFLTCTVEASRLCGAISVLCYISPGGGFPFPISRFAFRVLPHGGGWRVFVPAWSVLRCCGRSAAFGGGCARCVGYLLAAWGGEIAVCASRERKGTHSTASLGGQSTMRIQVLVVLLWAASHGRALAPTCSRWARQRGSGVSLRVAEASAEWVDLCAVHELPKPGHTGLATFPDQPWDAAVAVDATGEV